MKNKKTFLIILIVLIIVATLGLAAYYYLTANKYMIDYSDPARWVSLPTEADKKVDVFYLYPTAWSKTNQDDPNICDIDNESMLKGAKSVFNRQATAFETVGNIYAPYYRQADANWTLAMSPEERNQVIGDIPLSDAQAAFEYYLKHYNHGRPFILASHSQGSNVMTLLLSGYLKDHPEVYERMIVAYVIGYSITDEYLSENPHLKFAQNADDLGVIISYNTEAPDVALGANPVILPGALVINPITWTREETLATKDQGLGSYMPTLSGEFEEVPQYADAQINKEKGALICTTADEKVFAIIDKLSNFPKGVYHSFDYPFYYYNLRENAANRVDKFFNK